MILRTYKEEMTTAIEPVANAYRHDPERSGREPSCALTTNKSLVVTGTTGVSTQESEKEYQGPAVGYGHTMNESPVLPAALILSTATTNTERRESLCALTTVTTGVEF
jgi:hypothetical protein